MSELQPVTWYEDPAHFRRHSRREFLFTGLVGGLGLSLGNYFKLRAEELTQAAPLVPVAESLIHIYLPGGAAHQEMWDPKPLRAHRVSRAARHRRDLDPRRAVSREHLKNTAKIADKIWVVRSMTHGEAAHERGTHNMFTGYRPSPGAQLPLHGLGGFA